MANTGWNFRSCYTLFAVFDGVSRLGLGFTRTAAVRKVRPRGGARESKEKAHCRTLLRSDTYQALIPEDLNESPVTLSPTT